MDLLLGLQESHFEDVGDIGVDLHGLEVGVEETKDGILQSIEKNSNAVREKTDRIVGAANATIYNNNNFIAPLINLNYNTDKNKNKIKCMPAQNNHHWLIRLGRHP